MQETSSLQAGILLDGRSLIASAHWLAEAVNALWAYVQRGEIPVAQAMDGGQFLSRVPVREFSLPELTKPALAIAISQEVTVYDAFYLALARGQDTPFVTDDRRLMRKLAANRQAVADLVWIGDMA